MIRPEVRFTLQNVAHNVNEVTLFHEPRTGLDDCLIMLLSCFRKRMSEKRVAGGGAIW